MKREKANRTISYIALAICFPFFISCTSTYNFVIETQQPAEITLPIDVSHIVIVNNVAAPADSDFGTECFVNQKKVSIPLIIAFDSAFWSVTNVLAEGIQSEDFYSDVAVYGIPIRKDNSTLEIRPLSKQITNKLYDRSDAIISIDRCLFRYKQEVTQLASGYSLEPLYTFVNIRTDINLSCSVYLKGQDNPLTSFSLQDSLFFNTQTRSDSIHLYQTIPNIVINEATAYMGEKLTPYFVPSWKEVSRTLYTSIESRMKEALAYAKTDKWDSAENLWLQLYNQKKNDESRAHLAYNLAVAYEMQDNLEKSLDWAKKAESFFKQNNKKKFETDINRTSLYISSITERIDDNTLLDLIELRIEN